MNESQKKTEKMDEIDQDYIEKAFDDGVGLPSSFIVTKN